MVMKMDEGLDTGPVALADRLMIGPDATAGEIQDHLSLIGATLMLRALESLERSELTFAPAAPRRRDLRQQDFQR